MNPNRLIQPWSTVPGPTVAASTPFITPLEPRCPGPGGTASWLPSRGERRTAMAFVVGPLANAPGSPR